MNTLGRSRVFLNGTGGSRRREDEQEDPRSGQPKMQRTGAIVDRVRTLERSDRTLGVSLIAEELNVGICSEKRPELWPDKKILHHDNVPAYDALTVRKSASWPRNPLQKRTIHLTHLT
jgi:hypothetical protein